MRTIDIQCDVCKNPIPNSTRPLSLAVSARQPSNSNDGWTPYFIRKDACSLKCAYALLDEAKKLFDLSVWPPGELGPPPKAEEVRARAVVLNDAPVASPASEEPPSQGCNACDANIPFDETNAYRHTGEGPSCLVGGVAAKGPEGCSFISGITNQVCCREHGHEGDHWCNDKAPAQAPPKPYETPCTCPDTSKWVIEPPEGVCTGCWASWTAPEGSVGYVGSAVTGMVPAVVESTGGFVPNGQLQTSYGSAPVSPVAASVAPPAGGRGRGRPKGSKNRPKPGVAT